MPELPEVETTRRGIAPYIAGQTIAKVLVRQGRLRWPVPDNLSNVLKGLAIDQVDRRGKYLLLSTSAGVLLIHLGMSGSLRIITSGTQPGKHDHVDIQFDSGNALRFTDPRRFGCILWTTQPVFTHPLMKRLGPEPLTDTFDGAYLKRISKDRKTAVKSFIMDNHVVVGVGNIYANEALFAAGILPYRAAGKVSLQRYQLLSREIKSVLNHAIEVGGTTLRDFTGGDGQPGYFKQNLKVYGRLGMPCVDCNTALRERRIGQRSSIYCPRCQH